MATLTIDSQTLETLKLIQTEGVLAKITEQLDRAQYVKTDKVLGLLGGKWNRSKKAHVFNEPCAEILADAVATGEVFDAKKTYQEFYTPPILANHMVHSLMGENLKILEPSAGTGRIVKAARSKGHEVFAIEIQPKNKMILEQLTSQGMIGMDFISVQPETIGFFDAILMNPPFTKSQDIRHVLHAWSFLQPGGQIRAIMSPGFTFRKDSLAVEFREFLQSINADIEELPEGTFNESGTNVKTVFVSATK